MGYHAPAPQVVGWAVYTGGTMGAYSLDQATRLSGVSGQQIASMVQAGILGSHGAASIGFADIRLLQSVGRLLQEGVAFPYLRRVLESLRDERGNLSEFRFHTDGERIMVCHDGECWDAGSGQRPLPFGEGDEGEEARLPLPSVTALLPASDRADASLFDEAVEAEEDNPEHARDLYLQLLAEDPEHIDAMINLSRLCCQQGFWRRALSYCRIASKLAPAHPVPAFNAGVVYQESGELDAAAKAYRKALSLDAAFADAHYNLALVLHGLGDSEGAHRHLLAYRRAQADNS